VKKIKRRQRLGVPYRKPCGAKKVFWKGKARDKLLEQGGKENGKVNIHTKVKPGGGRKGARRAGKKRLVGS